MKMNRMLLGFLLGIVTPALHAHVRDYLDTYAPTTLEKGRSELELWTDLRNPDAGDSFWVHQTEVEYGVTDRYTLGVYGVFVDGQGFSAVKVENRFRPVLPASWPVDTAFYVEIQKANGHKENNEVEGKILLAKNWGKWNVTANPILELEESREANGDKSWEMESALALGTCVRRYWKNVTPGVELFFAEKKSRVTPGLYIDLASNVRLNLGVGIGLEKPADDAQLKSILEIEF
jgi:hypothetical protein